MLLTTTITGLDEARKLLGAHARQLPFAVSKALNETGRKIIAVEQGVMRSVFEQPKPFTVNALRLEPATKGNLVATVLPKDTEGADRGAGRWLAPEAMGGPRREKGFERSMRAAGILPAGMYIVPGEGAKLDAYGNWSRAHMNQVLVAMRAAGTVVAARRIERLKARDAQRKRAVRSRYFVLQQKTGDLEPGIYERKGTSWGEGVRPVAVFVESVPKYRRRFPFGQVAQRVAAKEFSATLNRTLAEAIATAR